jgi:quercetin dioxygenase-like cupin family protein
MDRREFEAGLRREGFEVIHGGQKPGHASEPHAHDFDVRIMVLGGEITVLRDGKAETFREGQHCEVPAGCMHAERVGPDGVAYVYGKVTRPATSS